MGSIWVDPSYAPHHCRILPLMFKQSLDFLNELATTIQMKRTPCRPGTIIGWCDLRSTIIEDLGGKTVRVKSEKSREEQVWE